MRIFLVYAVLLAAFGILFFRVRGFFGKAAVFVNRKIFSSLGLPDRVVRTALAALFISNILAAAASFLYYERDTVLRGFIRRDGYGGVRFTEDLVARVGEEEEEIRVEVDPRAYSEAEIEEMFASAAKALPAACLGDMPADHVDDDVRFPSALKDLPFSVSWFTDRPDVIDWDGTLLDAADPEGTPVKLTAAISFGEDTREEEIQICAYPRTLTESEARKKQILSAITSENSPENENLILPDTIGGKRAVWERAGGDRGLSLLLTGFILSILLLFSGIRNREADAERKKEEMLMDYPHIVSKLVLLLCAGLSMRSAFLMMASDYKESLENGGRRREGFEEILRLCSDMEKGLSEAEAYESMGRRACEIRYRTFAALLVQNMRRGSRELIDLLSGEADEAFEERKRKARILGEKAGTKLIFPTMLMLLVVIAVIMTPAFVSFL